MKRIIIVLLSLSILFSVCIRVQAAETVESVGTSIAASQEDIFIVNAKNELWVYTSPSNKYGMSLNTDYTIDSDGFIWYATEQKNELMKLMDNVSQVHHAGPFNDYILVLKTDGTLWRLSRGYSHTAEELAENAPKLLDTDVKSVSSWNYNILYLKRDKTLWQLDYHTLEAKKISDDVIYASAAFSDGLFIKSDNSLWNWDKRYQLSEKGEYEQVDTMTKVMEDVKYAAVNNSSFGSSYFAIKTDGSLWGWGRNSRGEIGNGGAYDSARALTLTSGGPIDIDETKPFYVELECYTPFKILENVISVYPNRNAIYAITEDSDVWVWGDSTIKIVNKYWVVLQDLEYEKTVPRKATYEFRDMAGIKIGENIYEYNTVIVKKDGSVWCKGETKYGMIGKDKEEYVKLMDGGVAGQFLMPEYIFCKRR